MSATAHRGAIGAAPAAPATRRLPSWWPLAALGVLAAALRLSTLDLQSLWFDEAFTPLHVLRPSLLSTLHAMAHTENSPPLWYVLEWADTRLLGTGAVALRLPSALAGIATVPVAWAIGRELEGPGTRRAAAACAALVAVNPLFVWYSQEARAYGLFVLTGALALLCFLRARREPARGRMAAFALAGALALLSHYFAVFLLAPMALWLLCERRTRAAALGAVGALALVGAALVPLILAQGAHNTQWIGAWPLRQRLEAIPEYYLTGYTGGVLGRTVQLLVALPILAGLALGAWRMRLAGAPPRAAAYGGAAAASVGGRDGEGRGGRPPAARDGWRRVLIVLSIAACGTLTPIVLVAFGADYLAPRNLVAAMIPLTAVIAATSVWPGTGRLGVAAAAAIALAFLAVCVDVDLSPRLQRGDWRTLARALTRSPAERVITTVLLGSAPLEYYVPGLHELGRGSSVTVREIDETGYAPLRAGAAEPPAPGFRLLARLDVHGLIAYRFVSPVARRVSEETLRAHVITSAGGGVLVPSGAHVSS